MIAGVMRWGSWFSNLDSAGYINLIEHCLSIGIDTFDHADIYGGYSTEADFGKALALKPSLRQDIHLVSKCGIMMPCDLRPSYKYKHYNTSKQHILASVENSLRNLQTDYLDLLLIHRPSPLMHPDEIAAAFYALKTSGKVLSFGVSNFTPSQFELLASRCELVTNQVEASLIHTTPFWDGTFDQCILKNIAPQAWSPFGGGALFGNDQRAKQIRAAVDTLKEKYGDYDLDQFALAWLLHHPAQVQPILGTAKKERLTAAMQAYNIQLSDQDWFLLLEASTGQEVP